MHPTKGFCDSRTTPEPLPRVGLVEKSILHILQSLSVVFNIYWFFFLRPSNIQGLRGLADTVSHTVALVSVLPRPYFEAAE